MARRPPRIPPKLGRAKRAIIEPRLRVTIYCEGKNTEPQYFNWIAATHGNGLVVVKSVPAAGVPQTLVEKAVASKREQRRQKNSFEERDQFWVAFDRDEHPNVPQAIASANAKGVGVAFSNPCFELWILLHLRDHDAPDDRHEIQKILRTNMPSYDPNGEKKCDLGTLAGSVRAACERAKRMRHRRCEQGAPRERPYTDVDLLVETIIQNGKAGQR